MNRRHKILELLSREEIPGALGLVQLLEQAGTMSAAEADARRQALRGWAAFNGLEAEATPNA